ncbi:MAG TPA: carboxypeptidase-like regulatory domain-containing protein, partial [Candidatus Angelobacter sp.]|nr:carboxypeptidase-like regulatory domain-containing protein [Candidatus Angelobacter sp.]
MALLLVTCTGLLAEPSAGRIAGKVLDPQGATVASARISLLNAAGTTVREATSDATGSFVLDGLDAGSYQISAEAAGFLQVIVNAGVSGSQASDITVQFQQIANAVQSLTVVASAPSSLTPDPAQNIVIHDEVLDANPGRPGAPISIPGLPIETASGGIKAPQYFAPGVAGDHGEPIAQYFQIGNFLYPNNLPANAHGNGYADPNFLIAPIIESVNVDGAAFNVREGNNSIDVAAAYAPRPRFNSFLQVTGDYRDADVIAGWSPTNPNTNAWIAGEFSFGNGYLDRLEHRQQYKLNGFREYHLGSHDLILFGVGYYGFSYVPGLIPIGVPVPGDTIDNRQRDITHTLLLIASDNWKLSQQRQFSFSGFYRNYALQLRSNFGDGLIQQSETRNVVGGEAMYVQSVRSWLAVLAGVDLRRDAPRNLDLKKIDDNSLFQPVTSNNVTLSFVEPFASLDGTAGRYLHFNLGFRQEAVWVNNQDLINPQNSFDTLATLTLPKGTLTLLPPDRWYLPIVSFSYGEAFHTNDPRIGNGTGDPTLIAPSRAYQLVI